MEKYYKSVRGENTLYFKVKKNQTLAPHSAKINLEVELLLMVRECIVNYERGRFSSNFTVDADINGKKFTVDDIIMSEQVRGFGLGTLLMREALETAKEHFAYEEIPAKFNLSSVDEVDFRGEVKTENIERRRRFYERFGFKLIGDSYACDDIRDANTNFHIRGVSEINITEFMKSYFILEKEFKKKDKLLEDSIKRYDRLFDEKIELQKKLWAFGALNAGLLATLFYCLF